MVVAGTLGYRLGPLRTIVRSLAELVLTGGIVLGLLAAWEIWGKSAEYTSAQHDADHQLEQLWSAPATTPPAPDTGAPFSRLYIPSLGQHWTIVDGVSQADLRKGPGHYPGTQQPGAIGNFAVAGHRSPSIFWNLDRLHAGSSIVVETRDQWFVYTVSKSEIVKPTQTSVLDPVPDEPGAAPDVASITLTTCNPKWGNKQRLIVFGSLQRAESKTSGRPMELGA